MAKRIFNNIKQYIQNINLKKDNRPVIFLVCLLIASILWFMNALGKRYETTISMPVKYTNLPKDKVLVKAPPSSLDIKMEAYGFTLLRHKIKLSINPLNFNYKEFINNSQQNKYTTSTERFIPQFSRQVSSEINLINVTPDSLHFEFDDVVIEKKPIKEDFELTFENQYFLYDSISFEPDSVELKGPQQILDTIKSVSTKKNRFKNLNATVVRNISLSEIKNIEIEPRRAVVTIPVSQYTEYNEKVPVAKLNVPDSINLVILPGKIDASCLVALEEYKNLSVSGFVIGVDYNDINENTNSLPIKVYKYPAHILSLKYQPHEVKYIIEKK